VSSGNGFHELRASFSPFRRVFFSAFFFSFFFVHLFLSIFIPFVSYSSSGLSSGADRWPMNRFFAL